MKNGNYLIGIVGLALSAAMALGQPVKVNKGSAVEQVQSVQPFTHAVLLPANVDPATIRFEKIKATRVPTEIKYTTNTSTCSQPAESGGSLYCRADKAQSYVAAYEITYSYLDPQYPYPSAYTTFHVYLHPDEISDVFRGKVTNKQMSRNKASEYFRVSAHTEPVSKLVIDDQKSTVCQGNFVDGLWSRSDSRCDDKISYTTTMAKADRLTVRVEAISLPGVQAANRTGN